MFSTKTSTEVGMVPLLKQLHGKTNWRKKCRNKEGDAMTFKQPRSTFAMQPPLKDVVYVAETAMCTKTKVFSVEYRHGQEKMATKQQYASCNMHIAAVLSHE